MNNTLYQSLRAGDLVETRDGSIFVITQIKSPEDSRYPIEGHELGKPGVAQSWDPTGKYFVGLQEPHRLDIVTVLPPRTATKEQLEDILDDLFLLKERSADLYTRLLDLYHNLP